MIEFDFEGQQYRAERLNAFQQFNVTRKVGPLLPPLFPAVLVAMKAGGVLNALDTIAGMLQPFMESLARMPAEDCELVISTCLSVVKRQTAGNWARIWDANSQRLMFQDIDNANAMIRLVIKVLQDSLGPFIAAALASMQESAAATETASPGTV